MVILIGGVGFAGKTLMAQKLLEKYKYPYLSVDHLKMGLYRADIGCGFTPYDSSEFIGEKLWDILKGIIMTNIENKQSLIIEGCYILPQKINELEPEYRRYIISFYLGFSESYIEKYFESHIVRNMRVIEARGYENDRTADDYILENKNQKDLCMKYGAKYFEIDENYLKEIVQVYDWIERETALKQYNMTVNNLIETLGLQVINLAYGELPVTGGYVCDLLSWVIGRAGENNAWITVMTNINTIAVAVLSGISCIILSEDTELDANAKEKAVSENINVFKSKKNSFELACELGKALAL